MEKAELVDNYLGMPGVTGKEMMERFRAHAAAQGAVLKAQRAGNVMPMGGTFLVGAGSDMYTSRAVILACGVSKAGYVPGEAEYLGRGVSYCATCDGMLYRQKRVAVWGLSPEAPEEAEFLHSIGCRVTYIAAKRPQALAQGIAFVSGAVTAVYGGAAVTAVDVKGEMLETDGLFILRPAAPAGCPRARHRHGERPRKNRRRHAHQHPPAVCRGRHAGRAASGGKGCGRGPYCRALRRRGHSEYGKEGKRMKRQDYISWDEYFMGIALLTAQRSKDNSSQVGACIVSRENKILSLGYNGMPIGCLDDEMPWGREGTPLETKYMYVCHAELNAILNHASGTGSLRGARVYTTLFPCNECAKAMIQSGIREVIYYEDKYPGSDSVIASKRMFDMVGVTYKHYEKSGRSVTLSL